MIAFHWPHQTEERPLCRPMLSLVGTATAYFVASSREAITCPTCRSIVQAEEPQRHPNCRAHGPDPFGDCNCEVWWGIEAEDCELIGAAACQLCGNLDCAGDDSCPENDIVQLRASRNRHRERTAELRGRLHDIRVRLQDHLGLPRTKGRRPTVEELLGQVLDGR